MLFAFKISLHKWWLSHVDCCPSARWGDLRIFNGALVCWKFQNHSNIFAKIMQDREMCFYLFMYDLFSFLTRARFSHVQSFGIFTKNFAHAINVYWVSLKFLLLRTGVVRRAHCYMLGTETLINWPNPTCFCGIWPIYQLIWAETQVSFSDRLSVIWLGSRLSVFTVSHFHLRQNHVSNFT